MKNQSSLLRWARLSVFGFMFAVCVGVLHPSAAQAVKAETRKGVDLITIDTMAAHGKLELPPVLFLHDKHTVALQKDGKDCTACHLPVKKGDKEELVFSYLNTQTLKGEEQKKAFHNGCIGCHTQMAQQGKNTGPLESSCRSCHNPRPDITSAQVVNEFNKIVHFKHTSSDAIPAPAGSDKNCASCHHTGFDKEKGRFIYTEGKEDKCGSCHYTEAEKAKVLAKNPNAEDEFGKVADRTDVRTAKHQACVTCHIDATKKQGGVLGVTQRMSDQNNVKFGPTDCASCHCPIIKDKNADISADEKVLSSIPRLMRGQPDAILMTTDKAVEGKYAGSMRPVSFDHKTHEQNAVSCGSCHHKKIAACSTCHTAGGDEKGDFVTFETAMHKADSNRSCIGCHNNEVKKPSCAGCHAAMPARTSEKSCATCHATPVGFSNAQAEDGSLTKLSKEDKITVAAATVAARQEQRVEGISQADIPDTVTISVLSDKYEPSTFPHRKIVKSLMEKQKNNQLAAAFHTESTTLCQACHHNSPASKTPPKCVSCHAKAEGVATDGRPALKAAYHLQCMGCHTQMQQKPVETDCSGCHKPSKK